MDISLMTDTLMLATKQSLSFSSIPLALQISSSIFPTDAVAPPPVKPTSIKSSRRTLLRRRRRTRKKSLSDGDDAAYSVFGSDGCYTAYTGGGGGFWSGGGGGGGSWNYGGGHSWNWEEDPSSRSSDPASDFVYEVICWISLSNCVHFAFKKVVRIIVDGIADPQRD